MAERENVGEVYLSVRNDDEDVSPECLAWADSCIISFPDDSDNNNWGNFRDALTEIIDIHPEMFVPSSSKGATSVLAPDEDMTEPDDMRTSKLEADSSNSSSSEEVSEIISLLRFESDPSKNSLQDHYFPDSMPENRETREVMDNRTIDLEGVVESIAEDGSVSNGEEEEEEAESLPFQVFKDDFMSTSIQDNVDDFNVLEDPVKVTPQEIFKVWDLEVVGDDDNEEDGLVLQLKKALDESSTVQPLPPPLNDDQVVVEKNSIDDLIAGISDLSLTETF